MISIAILLTFFSFYMWYNTSRRAVRYLGFGFENWMNMHSAHTKIVATFLCICSLILYIVSFGIGSGTLLFFTVLMTFGSMIVLLTPLHIITYKSISLIFLGALIIEFFAF